MTAPDGTAAGGNEAAGRGVAGKARHGITRGITQPQHSGSPTSSPGSSSGDRRDEPTTPLAGPGGAMPSEPLLYTAEQAAALLQVRPSWLRRKATARAVPCRFVGKHLRFSRADIDTIAHGTTTPHQHSS